MGQTDKTENYSGFPQWQELIGQGAVPDIILYPTEIMRDSPASRLFLESIKNNNTQVVLQIHDALRRGFTAEEIIQFIRMFPDKSRLHLQSVNNFMGSLTVQILRLSQGSAGLTPEELKALGVDIPPPTPAT